MSSPASSERTLSPPLSPPRSPSPPASAAELTTYAPLFRRRKPPVSEPPVPCLRCALVDMHCVYYRGDERCQRCARNGEGNAVCIFQRQDLTRPETRPTAQQLEQLEEEQRQAARARGPRHAWLMAHQQSHQQGQEEAGGATGGTPLLQCMVYSRDPALSRDRARLLALAAEMLEADEDKGTTYVHGQPVPAGDARNFVLPNWSPEYRKRAAFFEGHTAEQAAATARSRTLGRESRMAREGYADQQRREREEMDDAGAGGAGAEPEVAGEQDEY